MFGLCQILTCDLTEDKHLLAFSCSPDHLMLFVTLKQNSYNNPPTGSNPIRPAVAAMISGDKSAFYRCGFFGLQDTLWDVQGRHYFKLCSIQGAVDFVFGAGQSIYEVTHVH